MHSIVLLRCEERRGKSDSPHDNERAVCRCMGNAEANCWIRDKTTQRTSLQERKTVDSTGYCNSLFVSRLMVVLDGKYAFVHDCEENVPDSCHKSFIFSTQKGLSRIVDRFTSVARLCNNALKWTAAGDSIRSTRQQIPICRIGVGSSSLHVAKPCMFT